MAGRKTKLNAEVIGNISNWLKLGYYQMVAAVAPGEQIRNFHFFL